MEEFIFDLQHRAGTSHRNEDALSRKHPSSHMTTDTSCTQCRKRRMVHDVQGETVDACQDAKKPRGGGQADSPSRGYVHAVQMWTQKRRRQDHSPDVLDRDPTIDSDSEEPSSPVHRGKRHRHRDLVVN